MLLFKGLALLLPLLLLALIEGTLRLVGYGHDTRLFVEDPQQKGYWVMNRAASGKYFSDAANATVGNYEPFRQQKAEGTFRIFVLGESTTLGYPYFHNGSFHRWLQYRLMHTFPDRAFEVINLSLTAVNSYTVYGFAQEVVNYSPDAVLVYTGHNEYYGALGVGSTSAIVRSPRWVRAVLKLREFRLVQLINRTLGGIRKVISGKRVDGRENLMKRMAADQQIAYDSDAYREGIEQFKTNLNDLCRLLSDRHIPLLLSNLVSNEKDQKPFISSPGSNTASAQYQYEAGKRAYAGGDFKRAKRAFVRAKDLDLLRFRAPEALNKIIQELASRYPDVTVVDAKAAFERQSPGGILGEETLLEHVHPNLYGYALLSDAFYEAMRRKGLISADWGRGLSLAGLRQQMPITAVDSLRGAYEVMILKEGWPFNEPMPPAEKRPKTTEEQLAGALVVKQISWSDAMSQLFNHYVQKQDQRGALRVTEALELEYPTNPAYYLRAGKLCMHSAENERAVWHLKKAFGLDANFSTAQSLFVTLLKLDRPEEALTYLRYAAAHNESRMSLNELQLFVEQLIAVKKQYTTDTTNVNLSNQLAVGYLKFANAAGASKYVEKTLRVDRQNAVALQLREQIRAIQKD